LEKHEEALLVWEVWENAGESKAPLKNGREGLGKGYQDHQNHDYYPLQKGLEEYVLALT
jgi:hypothetical protein